MVKAIQGIPVLGFINTREEENTIRIILSDGSPTT